MIFLHPNKPRLYFSKNKGNSSENQQIDFKMYMEGNILRTSQSKLRKKLQPTTQESIQWRKTLYSVILVQKQTKIKCDKKKKTVLRRRPIYRQKIYKGKVGIANESSKNTSVDKIRKMQLICREKLN